jgi:hypothetical protein
MPDLVIGTMLATGLTLMLSCAANAQDAFAVDPYGMAATGQRGAQHNSGNHRFTQTAMFQGVQQAPQFCITGPGFSSRVQRLRR